MHLSENLLALIDLIKKGDNRIHPKISFDDVLRLADGDLRCIGQALINGFEVESEAGDKDYLLFNAPLSYYKVITPTKTIWGVTGIVPINKNDMHTDGTVAVYKVHCYNNKFYTTTLPYSELYSDNIPDINVFWFKRKEDAERVAKKLTELYFAK